MILLNTVLALDIYDAIDWPVIVAIPMLLWIWPLQAKLCNTVGSRRLSYCA